ncbi:MAG: hypothetical protein IAE82_21520 [Opitutaceae bacterium]|nr:hypothetical protein [Opitutaceae bacterium]
MDTLRSRLARVLVSLAKLAAVIRGGRIAERAMTGEAAARARAFAQALTFTQEKP